MTSSMQTAINPLHHNMSVTRLQDHKNKKVVPLNDQRMLTRTQSVDIKGRKLISTSYTKTKAQN